MKTCKICKQEKPNNEMRQWGGLPTSTCQVCFDAKAKGTTALVPANQESEPVAQSSMDGLKISVDASFGFEATVDGENLVITQSSGEREDVDAPDNITLTRSEARALFKLFSGWADRG